MQDVLSEGREHPQLEDLEAIGKPQEPSLLDITSFVMLIARIAKRTLSDKSVNQDQTKSS
jgi:hypothetical protein